MTRIPSPPDPTRRQRGFSLIELMVSLLLGLVVLGGVLTLYVSSQETFRTHEDMARIQENARFALDQLAREIREAGLTPCGSPLTANVLVNASGTGTPWWSDTAAGFLRGGEANGQGVVATGSAVADHAQGTDSLLVLRPTSDEGQVTRVAGHDTAVRQVSVLAPTRVSARDIVLMCDSGSSALWQVDAVNTPVGQLGYDASPLNCSSALGQVGPRCDSPADKTFPAGALLMPWDPGLWYVGEQGNGQRALYRARVIQPAAGASSANLVTQRVERIPGVSDFQIEYLTRNRENAGELAQGWVDATRLTNQWADPTKEVIAVRLAITLSSEAGRGGVMQRTFRSVVALRNREF